MYKNNYARAAAYFLGTCAPAPEEAGNLAAYRLITGIYRAIFENAEAVGFKPLPDTYFAPWEQQKGREKDVKSIREPITKIEVLIAELFSFVETGEATEDGLLLPEGHRALKRMLVKALALAGCEIESGTRTKIKMQSGCSQALKKLCAISKENIIHITDGQKEDKAYLYFSRCVFDPSVNWTAMAFDRLLKVDGCLVRLCDELEKRGYTRIDCRDGKKVSLDYVMQHGKKVEPLKMSWGERSHSGIEVSFEELRLEPCFIWIRIPMYKKVLSCSDKLPADVLAFLLNNTKNCDGCRYCVQTDKSGVRPLAAVSIGNENKCPLYPGFTMNWRALSPELSDKILALLDALNDLPELT